MSGVDRTLTHAERQSLALHEAVAQHVRRHPERAFAIARDNVAKMRAAASRATNTAALDRWEALLHEVPEAVVAMLTSTSADACDVMRPMSPFAGVLGQEERARILAEFRAANPR